MFIPRKKKKALCRAFFFSSSPPGNKMRLHYFFFVAAFAGAFFFALAAGLATAFLAADLAAGLAADLAAGFVAFAAGFFIAVGIETSLVRMRVWEPLNKINTLYVPRGGHLVLFSRSFYPLQEKNRRLRKKINATLQIFSFSDSARSSLFFDT